MKPSQGVGITCSLVPLKYFFSNFPLFLKIKILIFCFLLPEITFALHGWLGGGKGLLYLQQVGKGACYYFFCFCTVIRCFPHPPHFLFFLSSTSSSVPFLLSLGDDTKWPTRVDVSLNNNSTTTFALLFPSFLDVFSCSTDINDIIPLFPELLGAPPPPPPRSG